MTEEARVADLLEERPDLEDPLAGIYEVDANTEMWILTWCRART
jgi:hypothetical protein